MRRNFSIYQKGILLVTVPLLFQFAFVITLTFLLQQSEKQLQVESIARQIISHANLMLDALIGLSSAVADYAFSRDPDSAKNYEECYARSEREASRLYEVVKDNPEQLKAFERVQKRKKEMSAVLMEAKTRIDKADSVAGALASTPYLKRVKYLFRQISLSIDELLSGQRLIEKNSPKTQERQRNKIQITLWACIAANVLLTFALAKYFSTQIATRLNVLSDNSMKFARGQALNPLITGSDEIANLDKLFHNMAEELQELDKQKQELFAMVSHDLKTPLASTQGVLYLLESGSLGEISAAARERVVACEADISRLIRLINDLLNLEKIQQGKLEMLLREVSIDIVIQRSLISIESFAEQHAVTISCPADCTATIYADEDRVVQVLVNLLSNAIKFSTAGQSVEITVAESEKFVELQVKDQGRGVPKHAQELIFERFLQVSREDETLKGGSGLGLHVCKKIIESLGGSIGVESEEEKGSCFWIRLPNKSEALLNA